MSNISIEDVQKLTSLSALTLDETQLESMKDELSRIIDHIEHLSEVDTEGTLPTYQVTGLHNVMRSDEVTTSSVSPDALLDGAPQTEQGQIKVPRVLG